MLKESINFKERKKEYVEEFGEEKKEESFVIILNLK